MRRVTIDDTNCAREHAASAAAIRDFLYTFFDISVDCLPIGDWDRAALGEVDPFLYLDVEFVCQYSLRTPAEVEFLHVGAAVNLLCRVAVAFDGDEASGSTVVAAFCSAVASGADDEVLRVVSPELQAIYRAFASGRVPRATAIQSAFRAWLTGDARAFYQTLGIVRAEVIEPAFANLWRA